MQDDGHFDERVAASYDADAAMFDPAVVTPAVDLLAELADGGPVLEFGIGTGRIGLPLAERGLRVAGIDLSGAMVARLRAKSGGEVMEVAIGDLAETRVPGQFTLVYLVFNTITNLTTQAAQVACFQNAANHLTPGGQFVVEVFVPALRHLPPGQHLLPFALTDDHWGVDEYNTTTQAMTSHHIRMVDGRAERFSVPLRYVWPAELDLMARLAGLSLAHRWADWHREPFTAESTAHVSVWQKPG
ncbi:MAG: class I SAM-dependent methyltransferase [Pseudomonadota bacterium]